MADFQVSDPAPAPMIGGQVSDPPPAPMMGIAPPLPGRADFPGAQPPADWTRTYNEPAPAPGSMDPRALKEAEAAVQAALRFQGLRGFQDDVQSGVPPEKALLRHGPKMFSNNPAQFMMALKRLQPTPGEDMGPAQTVPALDTSGVPVPGVHILRSPHGYHVIHDPNVTGPEKQAAEGRKFKLSQLKDDLKIAKSSLSALPAESPRRAKIEAEISRLQKSAEDLIGGTKAASTVRVKHKKTGQLFDYKGAKEDVPLDQYEIQ